MTKKKYADAEALNSQDAPDPSILLVKQPINTPENMTEEERRAILFGANAHNNSQTARSDYPTEYPDNEHQEFEEAVQSEPVQQTPAIPVLNSSSVAPKKKGRLAKFLSEIKK